MATCNSATGAGSDAPESIDVDLGGGGCGGCGLGGCARDGCAPGGIGGARTGFDFGHGVHSNLELRIFFFLIFHKLILLIIS